MSALQTTKTLFSLNLRGALTTASSIGSGLSGSRSFHSELSDTQKEIRDVARKFAREEILPNAAKYDNTGEYPWDILKKAWALGILNTSIPIEYGGVGYPAANSCIILQECGYACTGISVVLSVCHLAQSPIIFAGNEDQKKKYLGRCIEEPIPVACAVTEAGGGSDVGALKTKAEKKGDEYILNGSKMWITNGGVANWYYVLARTDPDPKAPRSKAFTSFIVEKDFPGVIPGRKEETMGQRASNTSSVTFEDVRVPKENVVGAEGAGFKITMANFDKTRLGVAANATGLAWRALDEAAKYAIQRKTFGMPIAAHQSISHMLSDMATGVVTANLAWMLACKRFDRGLTNAFFSSLAKNYAADVANRNATDAVQIFGGNGYSKEYPVEKLMRDAKLFQIYEGTTQIHKLIMAKDIIERTLQKL